MGQVYLGQDANGQRVAVKVMHEILVDDDVFRARFESEVEAAKRVNGNYTARVIEADPHAPQPWFACEFIPGITLMEAIKDRRPLEGEALRILVLTLFEALMVIHSQGLVHRDLKPDNVILGPDGPRLIDFGIAYIQGQQGLTSPGDVIGTVEYMCPEQLDGGEPQPSWDIFALGSLIAFAATGKTLFNPDGKRPTAKIFDEIRLIQPDLGAIPSNIRPFVEYCLNKDPNQRLSLQSLAALLPGKLSATINNTSWLPDQIATEVIRKTKLMSLPTAATKVNSQSGGTRPYTNIYQPPAPRRARRKRKLPWKKMVGTACALVMTGIIGSVGYVAYQYKLDRDRSIAHEEEVRSTLPASLFTVGTLGDAKAKRNSTAKLTVNSVKADGYQLHLNVTASGYKSSNKKLFMNSCMRMDAPGAQNDIWSKPVTASVAKRENNKQSATLNFRLLHDGTYSFAVDCRSKKGVEVKVGKNSIHTLGLLSLRGRVLEVLSTRVEKQSRVVTLSNSVAVPKACLRTSKGPVFPSSRGANTTEKSLLTDLSFKTVEKGTLYMECITNKGKPQYRGRGVAVS